MSRLPVVLLGLALTGCALGDRGLESPHQPVVARNGATVPHCPDWSDAGRDVGEGQSSNFGCATNADLAAMVADPADLIHGKTDDGDRADVATRSIRALRAPAAPPKGS